MQEDINKMKSFEEHVEQPHCTRSFLKKRYGVTKLQDNKDHSGILTSNVIDKAYVCRQKETQNNASRCAIINNLQ